MSHLNRSSFSARVAYAKKCLLSGMRDYTRAFDDCFENGDGTYVMIRLWQEGEKNPALAARLKGFGTDSARALYETVKFLSPRAIGELSRMKPIN